MVGTAPGPGGHCEECKQPLINKTAFREHMKTHHGWQRVVCPLCPTWRERKNPSGLTKHIKKEHAGATWPAVLLEMALLYFFSVRPAQYRRINQIREAADKDTDMALEMIGRWASIVSEPRAHELVQRIQSDWEAHLQAVTSKRKCGVPKVTPPPPKRCRNLPDLTLLDMVLSARSTCQATLWSTLPGNTGELKVEFRLTQTPYHKATRVMETLMDAERLTLGDVSDVPQTISSPGLMQEVAATVDIHPRSTWFSCVKFVPLRLLSFPQALSPPYILPAPMHHLAPSIPGQCLPSAPPHCYRVQHLMPAASQLWRQCWQALKTFHLSMLSSL